MGEIIPAFVSFDRHLLESGVSESHIIEIAFDYYEYQKYRDPEVLYPYFKKIADVYVTGSNAKFLSKDIINEFRRWDDELYMNPLNFAEFMSIYQGNKYDGWNEYILYGGLPPVVLQTLS